MSNNRSCKKYDRMIEDYIDGLLSEKDKKELEDHLAECEDCRASLRFAFALREMTRSSAEQIPQGVHEKIMSGVDLQGRRRRLIRRGALTAACALIFAVSAAAWAMLPGRQKSEDVPPDNEPILQVTDEETENSLSQAPFEEPETDASPITPSVQGTADNNHTAEEAPVPDEPAIDTEAEEQVPGEPQTDSAAEITAAETITKATAEAETVMPSPEKNESPEATQAVVESQASPDTAILSAESLGAERPGGDDITLALLIVSGLLAVASFIAFLISLSSVRRIPSKKDKE